MLEFVRTDSWFFPGTPFNVVHLLAGIAVITSIVILIRRHSRPALVEAA
jgi:phosphatidylglycerol:prolipoprotein diacylglycerol transferase